MTCPHQSNRTGRPPPRLRAQRSPLGARPEMSLGEPATGPGLEVALEAFGVLRVGELERDDEGPRAVMDGHA